MDDPLRNRGRAWLLGITLVAAILQIAKLAIVGTWPTLGQWAQMLMVVSMFTWLWDGYNWARIATALYYLAVSVGAILVIVLGWPQADRTGLLMLLSFAVVTLSMAGILWFSSSIRHYVLTKRTA
jgi:hypothetical protein